ncbi:MAG: AAA family ATPase [Alphaproteobacteria bacterium]|nr:AAA family ATPase [Rickettsiales bacterium]
MISSLCIENVLLIDKLELCFDSGMSVITGETGAGKSIVVDCLSIVLGGKLKGNILRSKHKKGVIVGVFRVSSGGKLAEILTDRGVILEDDSIVIRRVIDINGSSKIFVCDIPSTVSFVSTIAPLLVEIRNQSSSLRNRDNHLWIDILDRCVGCGDKVKEVSCLFSKFVKIGNILNKKEEELKSWQQERGRLSRMIEDLERVDVKLGEEEQIIEQRNSVKTKARILDELLMFSNLLNKTDAIDVLKKGISSTSRLLCDCTFNTSVPNNTEKELNNLSQICEEALILFREVSGSVDDLTSKLWDSNQEFDEQEDRLHVIRSIARKYETISSILPEKLKSAREFADKNDNLLKEVESLKGELSTAKDDCLKSAQELSGIRISFAKKLSSAVLLHMGDLHLPNAKFEASVVTNKGYLTSKGIDAVEFLVSLNEGFDMTKVENVSGGEMSRIMLALTLSISRYCGVNCIVFDEIDSGVSGAVAIAIGKKILKLSKDVQVIVITHNHNVAACGECHFSVCKSAIDNIATIFVKKLEKKERIAAIASIVGNGTKDSNAHSFAQGIILGLDTENNNNND